MNEPFLAVSTSTAPYSSSEPSWWENITNSLPCFRKRKGLLLSNADLQLDSDLPSDGNVENLRQQLRALELRLLQSEQREAEERSARDAAVRELEKERAMRERTVETLATERKSRASLPTVPSSPQVATTAQTSAAPSVPLVEHQKLQREIQDERAARQQADKRAADERQQLTQQITMLKAEIARLQAATSSASSSTASASSATAAAESKIRLLQDEMQQLRDSYDAKIASLNSELTTQTAAAAAAAAATPVAGSGNGEQLEALQKRIAELEQEIAFRDSMSDAQSGAVAVTATPAARPPAVRRPIRPSPATPTPTTPTPAAAASTPTATASPPAAAAAAAAPTSTTSPVAAATATATTTAAAEPAAGDAGDECFSLDRLKAKTDLPATVDLTRLDEYLFPDEYPKVFGMTKEKYLALPKWQRSLKKKNAGLQISQRGCVACRTSKFDADGRLGPVVS